MKKEELTKPCGNCAVWSLPLIAGLLGIAFSPFPLLAQSGVSTFSFPDRGGVSFTTLGTSPAVNVGYARISETGAMPAGFAVFGLRQNSALVSEVTIPSANLIREGRIYAEIGGGVNTGIALLNTSSQPAQIVFYLTDSAGAQSGNTVVTIPANGQIAQFLTESPFNAPSIFQGALTFFALSPAPDLTLGAIALRGFINERGEFLMTSLPIAPIGPGGSFSGDTIPHFASGAGWATELILVNPTDADLAGAMTFTDQSGQPAVVATERGASSSFGYHVAPRSSWRLRTAGTSALQVGSVRIIPSTAGSDIPIGFLVFTLRSAGVTVTAASAPPARPGTASRLFVETSADAFGQPLSLQTGIAISNAASTAPVHVSFELTGLNGELTGFTGSLDIPAGGQVASFLTQIPGFSALPAAFEGVLRISASSAVTILGLRGRYNERGDFLVTTVATVNESDNYFASILQYSSFAFPHFVDGAGYTTQFVLFSGWTPGDVAGTLSFFTNTGALLPVIVQPH